MLSFESIVALFILGVILIAFPIVEKPIFKNYLAYEKANNIADMLVKGAPKSYLDELAGGYCYEIDDEKKCEGSAFEAQRSEWKETIKLRYVRVYT